MTIDVSSSYSELVRLSSLDSLDSICVDVTVC